MTILDPELMAARAPALIEENLRLRDLVRRMADQLSHLGNTELLVEARKILASA
ncbi:hypothetical protein BDE18_0387 [Paracoccus pantotrophus]|uniref:Uncharacterized protein n=1 Tax=Paracoccus pantotrophus TaxID=82367 RepID=A0ABX9SAP5_PARPN|nr:MULTISPECIES: hypothetical protein [Paracoccus]MBT0778032.1 hypothetical protein [Paracoccus sp. pheM1]RKS51156.1 hypothetical protein BDE18_0387 [Paracoccus pantotrophus]